MAYSAQPQINSHKEDYLPFDFVTSPYAHGASYNSFGFKYTSNFMLGFDGQRKFLTPRPGLTTDNTFLSAFPDRVEYCGQYFLYVLLGGNSFLFFYTLAPAGGATYNLYRWDGTTHTLTMSNVGAFCDFCEFTYISGQRGVFITPSVGANSAFFNITTSTLTTGLVGSSLRSPVAIDNYVFAYRDGTNDIQQCNFDNPLVWTPGDFITADLTPGRLMRMKKLKNYLVVFKTGGVEFFYNAGTASGSVLAQYETFFHKLQLSPNINGNNPQVDVIEYQDSLIFAGQKSGNKLGLYRLTTGSLDLITQDTGFSELVDTFTITALGLFHMRGYPFICVNNGNYRYSPSIDGGGILPTLFFDIINKNLVSMTIPFIAFEVGTPTGLSFLIDRASRSGFNPTRASIFNPKSIQDFGTNFDMSIYTGPVNHGTPYVKRCNKLLLDMSLMDNTTNPLVTLEMRSEYTNQAGIIRNFKFTPYLGGIEGTPRFNIHMTRLGKYRNRYYRLTFTNVGNFNLYGMSFNLDIGTD